MEAALLSGIGALGGAVAYLYFQVRAHHTWTVKRLEECEADKESLWKRLGKVEEKVNGET